VVSFHSRVDVDVMAQPNPGTACGVNASGTPRLFKTCRVRTPNTPQLFKTCRVEAPDTPRLFKSRDVADRTRPQLLNSRGDLAAAADGHAPESRAAGAASRIPGFALASVAGIPDHGQGPGCGPAPGPTRRPQVFTARRVCGRHGRPYR
jgi:hypothetical protein